MASRSTASLQGNSGGGAGGERPPFDRCAGCGNPHNPQIACWPPCLACNGRWHHPDNCPQARQVAGYQGHLQDQRPLPPLGDAEGPPPVGDAPPWMRNWPNIPPLILRMAIMSPEQQVRALVEDAGPTPPGVNQEEDAERVESAAQVIFTQNLSFRAFASVATRLNTSIVRAVIAWSSDGIALNEQEVGLNIEMHRLHQS